MKWEKTWIEQHQNRFTRHSYIVHFCCEFTPETATLSHVFLICSCTWVSLWVREETTAWRRSAIRSSFLSSPSTCCWRVSAPHSLMCRTLSLSMNACEGPNREKKNQFIYFCVVCCWSCPCYLINSVTDFRLAFFELTFQFCTTQQLQWEVIRHYSKQVTHMHNDKAVVTQKLQKCVKCWLQLSLPVFIYAYCRLLNRCMCWCWAWMYLEILLDWSEDCRREWKPSFMSLIR